MKKPKPETEKARQKRIAKEQAKAHKEWQKTVIPGYKLNDFNNRETRRRIARRSGTFKHPDAWKNLHQIEGFKNVQTYHRSNKK